MNPARLLILPLLMIACSTPDGHTEEIKFETIGKGPQSGIRQAEQVVIKSAEEWKTFWEKHTRNATPPSKPPPIDFSKEIIIGVFMGEKRTGGYGITIKRVTTGKEIVVHYKELAPEPGSIVTMALTSPYHLISIPKTTKKVVFKPE